MKIYILCLCTLEAEYFLCDINQYVNKFDDIFLKAQNSFKINLICSSRCERAFNVFLFVNIKNA